MNSRTHYLVTFGKNNCARFSHRDDAMKFARMVSLESHDSKPWAASGFSEVFAKDGIIGQFHYGIATPEFAHLNN